MDDMPLIAGAVGRGAAQQFIGFVEVYAQIPKLPDILANPATCRVPDEPSMTFALATYLSEHITDTNAEKVIEYLNRLPVECRIVCMRLVGVRKPKLLMHKSIAPLWQVLMTMM